MPLKLLTQEEIMQASGEHKHSAIECFLTLNERVISKTQKTPSLSIVNKLSDMH